MSYIVDMVDAAKFIGGQLRRARLEAEMSRNTLAARLKCTDVTICNWEGGVTQPKANDLTMLANALGKSVAFFYGRSDI